MLKDGATGEELTEAEVEGLKEGDKVQRNLEETEDKAYDPEDPNEDKDEEIPADDAAAQEEMAAGADCCLWRLLVMSKRSSLHRLRPEALHESIQDASRAQQQSGGSFPSLSMSPFLAVPVSVESQPAGCCRSGMLLPSSPNGEVGFGLLHLQWSVLLLLVCKHWEINGSEYCAAWQTHISIGQHVN